MPPRRRRSPLCAGRSNAAAPSSSDTLNRVGCPSREILDHVTSRWGVLILAALLERSYRFSELRRRIGGISEKMPAETLRALDRDGFVHRDAQPVIPPHVEYSLTPLGREVGEQVWALTQWVERQAPTVFKARDAYDAARAKTD